jgi:signal transduction histidine kinase/PAS domain-containing protein
LQQQLAVLEASSERPFKTPADCVPQPATDQYDRTAAHIDKQRERRELLRIAELFEQRADALESILDTIPVGIGIADGPSCSNVRINRAFAKILSLPQSTDGALWSLDVNQLPCRFVHDGVEIPLQELPLHHAAMTGDEVDTEFTIEFEDGRCVTVWQASRPLRDAHGRVQGSVCVTTDVTEQRRNARATKFLIRASEILASSFDLERVFSSLSRQVVPYVANLFAVDLLTDSGETERVASRMTHITADSEHIQIEHLLLPEQFADHPAHDVLRTGVPFFANGLDGEIADKFSNDHQLREQLHTLSLTSVIVVPMEARGRTLGVLTLATRGTSRVFDRKDLAMAAELGRRTAIAVDNIRLLMVAERSREEAQRANRAKSDFLAAMSHELRTPLNAIAGYTQLMLMGLRGDLTIEQEEDLTRISQNQRHLLGLINSILNYAKLDAGVVQYESSEVNVSELLRSIDAMIAPQMTLKGLHFKQELCSDDVFIEADGDKVRQVVLNLVSNAIKFTPLGGSITLGAQVANAHVSIYVHDTGAGIAPAKLTRIFEPFVQVDRTLSTRHEGVGLGLAISRDLARGMGGDITVQSTVGQGSLFTVTFPLRR